MRLTDIAEATVSQIVGRLMRRAVLFALLGILAIVTLYYASAAGSVALALTYGPITAYLVMAGIYALLAIAVLITILATRPKAAAVQDSLGSPLASPRNMQIAMLVEAVMLGYTLARKSGGKSLL
jgi:hypothetical protein